MKTLFLSGLARAGTSWLGKIFAAHPEVLYHYEPFNLVALRQDLPGYLRYWELLPQLKELVAAGQVEEAVRQFAAPLDRLAQVRDHILDRKPFFPQPANPKWMAIKEDFCMMSEVCGAIGNVIQIVRDPRAQLNSLWNNTQFGRHYGCVSVAQRWVETGNRILELRDQAPDTYRVIVYEGLCANPLSGARLLYEWIGLDWHENVAAFISESHSRHEADAYHVFKNPAIPLHGWRRGLSPTVQQAVLKTARGSRAAVELYNNFEGE